MNATWKWKIEQFPAQRTSCKFSILHNTPRFERDIFTIDFYLIDKFYYDLIFFPLYLFRAIECVFQYFRMEELLRFLRHIFKYILHRRFSKNNMFNITS